MGADNELAERFGDPLSPGRETEWMAARSRFGVGESCSGQVIARRPFGVFVDIGIGFPALLEITQFEHTGQRRYRNLEDFPALGTTITARIVAFNDRNRQIVLTQLAPHPLLDPAT
jgi:ribosomal protein S1